MSLECFFHLFIMSAQEQSNIHPHSCTAVVVSTSGPSDGHSLQDIDAEAGGLVLAQRPSRSQASQ